MPPAGCGRGGAGRGHGGGGAGNLQPSLLARQARDSEPGGRAQRAQRAQPAQRVVSRDGSVTRLTLSLLIARSRQWPMARYAGYEMLTEGAARCTTALPRCPYWRVPLQGSPYLSISLFWHDCQRGRSTAKKMPCVPKATYQGRATGQARSVFPTLLPPGAHAYAIRPMPFRAPLLERALA